MTRSIERRLASLEAKSRSDAEGSLVVGVASAPIPNGDLKAWTKSLLTELDAPRHCFLTVIPGERDMLVPFTPLRWLNGEHEKKWIDASKGDHVAIAADADDLFVQRFESHEAVMKWSADLEREMAAAGGPDKWLAGANSAA